MSGPTHDFIGWSCANCGNSEPLNGMSEIITSQELNMNTHKKYSQIFKLWKDFTFEAAHQLTKVPSGHQCARLHGHSYKIRIHCKGILDPARDWVVDYAEIATAVRPIITKLDHSFLNHHFDFETTAENLAWWIACDLKSRLPTLFAVELFETPTTSVIFEVQ